MARQTVDPMTAEIRPQTLWKLTYDQRWLHPDQRCYGHECKVVLQRISGGPTPLAFFVGARAGGAPNTFCVDLHTLRRVWRDGHIRPLPPTKPRTAAT
jgi:hypothetical protein